MHHMLNYTVLKKIFNNCVILDDEFTLKISPDIGKLTGYVAPHVWQDGGQGRELDWDRSYPEESGCGTTLLPFL